jgi:hypothetical protein
VIVDEGEAELRGVEYDIVFMLPPVFTLAGILAMSDKAVVAKLFTLVILVEEDYKFCIVVLIAERLELR